MKIAYSRKALRFLWNINPEDKQAIRKAINRQLGVFPPAGNVRKLRGEKGTFRLRVRNWRVLFSYKGEGKGCSVLIKDIGNRGDVYK